MFDHFRPDHHPGFELATPIHDFVQNNRDALADAAALLAGRRGVGLVLDLADSMASGQPLTRRSRKQLDDLLDILSLELVDDMESDEAARFALLDPSAPYVDEICLLVDGLRDALEQTDLDHPSASHLRSVA